MALIGPDVGHGTRSKQSVLNPVLRAYAVAYASLVGPRLLNLLLSLHGKTPQNASFLSKLYAIIRASLALNTFPTFCAALVGGYTLVQTLLQTCLHYVRVPLISRGWITRHCNHFIITRLLAGFSAAWLSLQILNDRSEPQRKIDTGISNDAGVIQQEMAPSTAIEIATQVDILESHHVLSGPRTPYPMVGKTIDLTILAATRAIETIIGDLWARRRTSRLVRNQWSALDSAISRFTDAVVFALSSGAIMWAWFYLPDALPRAYNEWIYQAAQIDRRLIQALRRARWGEFVYGKDTGQAPLLQSMCKEYDWPVIWGDPVNTIPIPCEMVHMGTGPSCHRHALTRFARAFRFALATYLPLQILVKARNPSMRAFRLACKDALRSSAFLGAFVGIFYYSVCFSRTLVGPKLFSRERITPIMWDQGLCIGAGCTMCGWSILIEAENRRQEVAFFVAPRAAATFFPRRYDRVYFWRERLAFSLSIAILFTYAQQDPAKIRGVLGHLLHRVLQ